MEKPLQVGCGTLTIGLMEIPLDKVEALLMVDAVRLIALGKNLPKTNMFGRFKNHVIRRHQIHIRQRFGQ